MSNLTKLLNSIYILLFTLGMILITIIWKLLVFDKKILLLTISRSNIFSHSIYKSTIF